MMLKIFYNKNENYYILTNEHNFILEVGGLKTFNYIEYLIKFIYFKYNISNALRKLDLSKCQLIAYFEKDDIKMVFPEYFI